MSKSFKGDKTMARLTTEYVFHTATDASGMNKDDTVMFHLYNPNGLVSKLPEFEDFIHGDIFFTGCEMLYGRRTNYYAKWLSKVVHKPKSYTRWQLFYHIRELEKDIEKAWATLKTKKVAA